MLSFMPSIDPPFNADNVRFSEISGHSIGDFYFSIGHYGEKGENLDDALCDLDLKEHKKISRNFDGRTIFTWDELSDSLYKITNSMKNYDFDIDIFPLQHDFFHLPNHEKILNFIGDKDKINELFTEILTEEKPDLYSFIFDDVEIFLKELEILKDESKNEFEERKEKIREDFLTQLNLLKKDVIEDFNYYRVKK